MKGSVGWAEKDAMLQIAFALLTALYAFEPAQAAGREPFGRLHCVPPRETRELVEQHRLQSPVAAVAAAHRTAPGELLAARLCERGGGYVYMLHLLGRDGRVQRVLVDAMTAEVIGNR